MMINFVGFHEYESGFSRVYFLEGECEIVGDGGWGEGQVGLGWEEEEGGPAVNPTSPSHKSVEMEEEGGGEVLLDWRREEGELLGGELGEREGEEEEGGGGGYHEGGSGRMKHQPLHLPSRPFLTWSVEI